MLTPQFLLPLADELVVDNFAGGGGASTFQTMGQYRSALMALLTAHENGRTERAATAQPLSVRSSDEFCSDRSA